MKRVQRGHKTRRGMGQEAKWAVICCSSARWCGPSPHDPGLGKRRCVGAGSFIVSLDDGASPQAGSGAGQEEDEEVVYL